MQEPFNPRWVIKNIGQNLKVSIKTPSLSELMRPHYNEIVNVPVSNEPQVLTVVRTDAKELNSLRSSTL